MEIDEKKEQEIVSEMSKKTESLFLKTHDDLGNRIDKEKETKLIQHIKDTHIDPLPPLTIDEITFQLRNFLMDLVSQGRPVAFETIINVLMNTYVSMLFNFQKRSDVVPTIRQHTEMVIEQILAAKMHEEEDDFTAKPEILLP